MNSEKFKKATEIDDTLNKAEQHLKDVQYAILKQDERADSRVVVSGYGVNSVSITHLSSKNTLEAEEKYLIDKIKKIKIEFAKL
jgi:hypothetical protein